MGRAGLGQVAHHLHPRHVVGMGGQGPVEDRVEGEGHNVGQGDDVGGLAVSLDDDDVELPGEDLHHSRRQAVDALASDGLNGTMQRA